MLIDYCWVLSACHAEPVESKTCHPFLSTSLRINSQLRVTLWISRMMVKSLRGIGDGVVLNSAAVAFFGEANNLLSVIVA